MAHVEAGKNMKGRNLSVEEERQYTKCVGGRTWWGNHWGRHPTSTPSTCAGAHQMPMAGGFIGHSSMMP